ncbi:HAAS signaling domain-containing protein [Micromonospora sp. NPDC004704]
MTARNGEGATQRSEEGMTEQEIADYVERVRRALSDLSPEDRDELLEDLPEHLAEVAADGTGALVDRLGTSEAYAAELRAAAGLRAPDPSPDLDRRVATAVHQLRGRLRVLDGRVGPVIGYAKASEFLRLLRPAWWVLRGYLVAMLVTVMLTGDSFGLLPRLGGNTLAAVLLLGLCVVGSIWLGRRAAPRRGWRRHLMHLGTVALVLFGLIGFADVDQRGQQTNYYAPSYNEDPYSGVQDVYVYDRQGRLVEGVRLFDQDGRPIRLGHPWCDDLVQFPVEPGDVVRDPLRQPYPYCPEGAPFRFSTGPVPSPTTPAPTPTGTPTPSEAPTPTGTGTPTPTGSAPPVGPSATTG